MNSTTMDYVKKQVRRGTPVAIIKVIATQIERVNEAKRRIETEGIVVRDMKGSVIAHPAIKIEIEAGKILSDLLKKNSRQISL